MTLQIPVLETRRLRLRAHRRDDFAASAAMWGDARITAHIGGRPFTPEECWARLLRYAGLWALLGFGYWVIARRDDGAFLGEAGFADFHRAIDSPHADLPEIGWAIAPDHQRQGYASEAVAAIVQWGDRHFETRPGAGRSFCIIDPDNGASARIAQKTGYRLAEDTSYQGNPVRLYLR